MRGLSLEMLCELEDSGNINIIELALEHLNRDYCTIYKLLSGPLPDEPEDWVQESQEKLSYLQERFDCDSDLESSPRFVRFLIDLFAIDFHSIKTKHIWDWRFDVGCLIHSAWIDAKFPQYEGERVLGSSLFDAYATLSNICRIVKRYDELNANQPNQPEETTNDQDNQDSPRDEP